MRLKTNYTPLELFQLWFSRNFVSAYDMTKRSDIDRMEFRKLKVKFARQKKAMKYLIKVGAWYPTDGPKNREWLKLLLDKAKSAEVAAMERLGIEGKNMSISDLNKAEDPNLEWPIEMPQTARNWFDDKGNNPKGKPKRS
jgi:hypothetical protein